MTNKLKIKGLLEQIKNIQFSKSPRVKTNGVIAPLCLGKKLKNKNCKIAKLQNCKMTENEQL